jgi:hypothetical protein
MFLSQNLFFNFTKETENDEDEEEDEEKRARSKLQFYLSYGYNRYFNLYVLKLHFIPKKYYRKFSEFILISP